MRRRLIAALAAAALIGLFGAPARAEGTIKFGVAAEPYPPFSSKDASGKWVGFEIDLMDAICAEMKAKCELVETAWDGIVPALTSGKIDVIWSSMSITPDRKKVIDFTEKYYSTPAYIIGPKSEKIKVDPLHPESVKGKVIGAQTATFHLQFVEKYFGKYAEIKSYDTQDNADADLAAGRLDLVMADSIALLDFLKGDQGKDFEVKDEIPSTFDPLMGEGVGGGVRKDDTALKAKLDKAIDAVRADGTYDKIAKKYFDFNIYGT